MPRIASFETFVVRYPIQGSFRFLPNPSATGRTEPATRDTIVVKITDDSGHIGWGQSVPSRRWSYETLETVQTTLDAYLGPALIGIDPADGKRIESILGSEIAPAFSTGQPICKAGIDLALFDLVGRASRQTASDRWGRPLLDHLVLSWTIDVGAVDEVGDTISAASAEGFGNFNLKIGKDADLDLEVCREARRLAPDATIWVDANGGYDMDTATRVARHLAEWGIAAFEQPFPANRLSWYAKLRRQGVLPILMDEGIVTQVDLEEFHDAGCLDGVALKVSRCGGLTEALKIGNSLEERGLLLFASGLTDPDLSFAASLLLFGALGLRVPAALNAPQFLQGTILAQPLSRQGDRMAVPTGFGLGVEVADLQGPRPH